MKIVLQSIEASVQMVQTRMPFRYGSATLVRCPHLYLIVEIEDGQGRVAKGIASDNLPPLWFDKDPSKSFSRQIEDQLQVIGWAAESALTEPATTPFRLWLSTYRAVQQKGAGAGLPALLSGFGPSLVERAVNDAVGRLLEQPFRQLLAAGELGIELESMDSSLAGTRLEDILPPQPVQSVAARHTVGLSDPIRTAEIPPEERLHDGLPQSLEEVIHFYGVRYFKIKTQNRLDLDRERLTSIARLLDTVLPETGYACTLDGNEQYDSLEELLPLLEALRTRSELRRLAESILFIEQPLARSAALDPDRCRAMPLVSRQFPVIIDESDDALDAFSRALELGYRGTSHKNCKNTFKSLANLAREKRAGAAGGRPLILSAEDLTNIGIVALHQDLVALSALGITHAERNGHHYFRGLSHLTDRDQQEALKEHGSLYTPSEGCVRLNVSGGEIDCRSLHQLPGLGVGVWPTLEDTFSLSNAADRESLRKKVLAGMEEAK